MVYNYCQSSSKYIPSGKLFCPKRTVFEQAMARSICNLVNAGGAAVNCLNTIVHVLVARTLSVTRGADTRWIPDISTAQFYWATTTHTNILLASTVWVCQYKTTINVYAKHCHWVSEFICIRHRRCSVESLAGGFECVSWCSEQRCSAQHFDSHWSGHRL